MKVKIVLYSILISLLDGFKHVFISFYCLFQISRRSCLFALVFLLNNFMSCLHHQFQVSLSSLFSSFISHLKDFFRYRSPFQLHLCSGLKDQVMRVKPLNFACFQWSWRRKDCLVSSFRFMVCFSLELKYLPVFYQMPTWINLFNK